MEFTKNKQGVSQDYQEKMNTLFRMDNHLEVVGKEEVLQRILAS